MIGDHLPDLRQVRRVHRKHLLDHRLRPVAVARLLVQARHFQQLFAQPRFGRLDAGAPARQCLFAQPVRLHEWRRTRALQQRRLQLRVRLLHLLRQRTARTCQPHRRHDRSPHFPVPPDAGNDDAPVKGRRVDHFFFGRYRSVMVPS
ncbi:hypothetical protein B1L07_02080 [Stenotrophomonas acidaminiphila]|nr:hypothetical protein B1L07_02080 [Stenotrophomonas acidaminiphila]